MSRIQTFALHLTPPRREPSIPEIGKKVFSAGHGMPETTAVGGKPLLKLKDIRYPLGVSFHRGLLFSGSSRPLVSNEAVTRMAEENLLTPRELYQAIRKTGNPHLGRLPEILKTTGLDESSLWQTLDELSAALDKLEPESYSSLPLSEGKKFNDLSFSVQIGYATVTVQNLGAGSYGRAYRLSFNDNPDLDLVLKVFMKSYRNKDMLTFSHGSYPEAAIGFHATRQQVREFSKTYAANPEKGWLLDEYIYRQKPARREGMDLADYEERFGIQFFETYGSNAIWPYVIDKGGFRRLGQEWEGWVQTRPLHNRAITNLEEALQAKKNGDPNWEGIITKDNYSFFWEIIPTNINEELDKEAFYYFLSKPELQHQVKFLLGNLPREIRVQAFKDAISQPGARTGIFAKRPLKDLNREEVRECIEAAMQYPETRLDLLREFRFVANQDLLGSSQWMDRLLAFEETLPYRIHAEYRFDLIPGYLAKECEFVSPC